MRTTTVNEGVRIRHLIKVHGIYGAKVEVCGIVHTYFLYIQGLIRDKQGRPVMTMYYDAMRGSIDQFLKFIES